MNFISRAWLYMIRKKRKEYSALFVLLIMATFVLTALALGNASDAAQQNLRKSLGGANIHFDYSDNNPYLKVEETESGIIAYCTQQIEPELVEKIRAIDGVKSCSAQVGSVVDCPELELFEGTLPVDEELKNSTNIVGVWKGEEVFPLYIRRDCPLRAGTLRRRTKEKLSSVKIWPNRMA